MRTEPHFLSVMNEEDRHALFVEMTAKIMQKENQGLTDAELNDIGSNRNINVGHM